MKALNSIEYWNKLKLESNDHPVILLKHSNTCPISLGAFERIKELEESNQVEEPIHILIVQESEDISYQIAKDLGVKHESPQIILMIDEKAVYHESHEEITGEALLKAYQKALS